MLCESNQQSSYYEKTLKSLMLQNKQYCNHYRLQVIKVWRLFTKYFIYSRQLPFISKIHFFIRVRYAFIPKMFAFIRESYIRVSSPKYLVTRKFCGCKRTFRIIWRIVRIYFKSFAFISGMYLIWTKISSCGPSYCLSSFCMLTFYILYFILQPNWV